MLPASTLRISGWLIYVFSVFTLMTGAPAFARVLIIVDKSTQQMSVSVDGVPRYRFAGVNWPGGVRDAERHLPSAAFSGLVVFEAVLQFAYASFDLLPRGICNPWQL